MILKEKFKSLEDKARESIREHPIRSSIFYFGNFLLNSSAYIRKNGPMERLHKAEIYLIGAGLELFRADCYYLLYNLIKN